MFSLGMQGFCNGFKINGTKVRNRQGYIAVPAFVQGNLAISFYKGT